MRFTPSLFIGQNEGLSAYPIPLGPAPSPTPSVVTGSLVYFWDWAESGSVSYDPGSSAGANPKTWDYRFYDKINNAYMYLFDMQLGTDIETNWCNIPGTGAKSGWMLGTSNAVNLGSTDLTIESWIDTQSGGNTYSRFGGEPLLLQTAVLSGQKDYQGTTVDFPNLYFAPTPLTYDLTSQLPYRQQNAGMLDIGPPPPTGPAKIYISVESKPYFTILNDRFYHYVLTWNNSTGELKFYLNTFNVANANRPSSTNLNFGTAEWHIGEDYDSNFDSTDTQRRSVKSRIGNQRVYNRILSKEEILQNWYAEQSLYVEY